MPAFFLLFFGLGCLAVAFGLGSVQTSRSGFLLVSGGALLFLCSFFIAYTQTAPPSY